MVSYSDWYVIYLTYNYRMETPVLNLILSCEVPNAWSVQTSMLVMEPKRLNPKTGMYLWFLQ